MATGNDDNQAAQTENEQGTDQGASSKEEKTAMKNQLDSDAKPDAHSAEAGLYQQGGAGDHHGL